MVVRPRGGTVSAASKLRRRLKREGERLLEREVELTNAGIASNPMGEDIWCAFCDCPLTAVDIAAGYCTNCFKPVLFRSHDELTDALKKLAFGRPLRREAEAIFKKFKLPRIKKGRRGKKRRRHGKR